VSRSFYAVYSNRGKRKKSGGRPDGVDHREATLLPSLGHTTRLHAYLWKWEFERVNRPENRWLKARVEG
jgi:hypothetical protein